MGQATVRFRPNPNRVRRALRLLPLPLSIAVCLPAWADDKPLNWGLCPATDVIPAFTDAPTPVPGLWPAMRSTPCATLWLALLCSRVAAAISFIVSAVRPLWALMTRSTAPASLARCTP